MKRKEIKIWAAKNFNSTITLFCSEPKCNLETGLWEGDIFLDSRLYADLCPVLLESYEDRCLPWTYEPEEFIINYDNY